MKPSERAEQLGCRTLESVATAVNQSIQTLINWHRSRPLVFDACCQYAANKEKENKNEK